MKRSAWPTFGGIFGVLIATAPSVLLPNFLRETGTLAANRSLSLLLALTLPALALALFREPASPRRHIYDVEEQVFRRFGLDERPLFLRQTALRTLALTLFATFVGGLVLCHSRSLSDPLLLRDLKETLPVLALGSAAYGLAAAASHLFRGRGSLYVFIAGNFVIGQLDVAVSVATPLGELRHLLALGPDLGFLPLYSSVALFLFSLFAALLLVRQAPR